MREAPCGTTEPQTAVAVVAEDLDYCCHHLAEELDAMRGTHVLLTGGAGFLGYYLIQTFLEWNRRAGAAASISLTVVDNYIRGAPAWLRQLRDERLHLADHDVRVPLPDALGEFEYVLHAASIASPTFYRQHPLATMDANVNGVRLLLERTRAQHRRPLRGLLFFSSSEIYGDPEAEAIPTPETYPGRVSSIGPRACYDESKRYGETLCVTFARQYGLPVAIARPFNNYGPGLKITDRRVIPDLAQDLLAGRDLVLRSDGSPTRTFCYVADAVVGYVKVLVRGRAGEAYNIGSDDPEISMAELASRMAARGRALCGYSGRVVCRPSVEREYLTDNPQRRCPDIRKARRELGFAPGVTLVDGLERTLVWYRENYEAPEA